MLEIDGIELQSCSTEQRSMAKKLICGFLGCILGHLLSLEPLFPGTSHINKLSRLVKVLGSPTEENWTGFSNLPDYRKLCFPGDALIFLIIEILLDEMGNP